MMTSTKSMWFVHLSLPFCEDAGVYRSNLDLFGERGVHVACRPSLAAVIRHPSR